MGRKCVSFFMPKNLQIFKEIIFSNKKEKVEFLK